MNESPHEKAWDILRAKLTVFDDEHQLTVDEILRLMVTSMAEALA